MKRAKPVYTACFVDREVLEEYLKDRYPDRLERAIDWPHVTVSYMPDHVPEDLVGTLVRIRVTGYGNDGTNEGLLVTTESDDPALQALLDGIQRPHITISVSAEGRPVDTAGLDFGPARPADLEGIFGVFEAGRPRLVPFSE